MGPTIRDGLELNLVCVIDTKDGSKQYFGVNDKHFDAMLAAGTVDGYEWNWVGEVFISSDILFEQGYEQNKI